MNVSGLELHGSAPHARSLRMRRIPAFIRHHLAGSGMLIALLLLCAFFSIATWTRQYPQNAAAVEDVAAQISSQAKALIVVLSLIHI